MPAHTRNSRQGPIAPLIRIWAGGLHINAKDAAKVLGAETHANPFDGVYRRGNLLVRTGRIYNGAELERAGVRRSPGTLTILAADVDYLTLALTKAARWEKFDKREEEWVPINAPSNIAKSIVAAADQLGYIPVLSGIVEAPTIRDDGSLVDQPGYDPATRLLFDPGGIEFPTIPDKPTRAQAEVALKTLREPLAEFPFVDEASESVELSKIITALTRKAMRAAPLHADDAPKMASGKTLLATIAGYIATSRPPPMMSQAEDAESERKRMLAVLLEGAPIVVIDNVERPLKSDALCSVLTEPLFTDRLLGFSKTATAPTNAVFVATGNNIVIMGDLTARTIVCALDPECERPEERRFKLNLHEWVPAHRGELVAAALTIVRAYLAAGEPMKGKLPNFARFEDWCRFVREPLVWSGMADPCLTRQRIEVKDPIRERLTALLSAWAEVFPTAGATVAEAIARAEETTANTAPLNPVVHVHPVLREAIYAVAEERGRINPRRLANFIASHAGRVEGGKRFIRIGTRQHAALWSVSSVSSVSRSQPFARDLDDATEPTYSQEPATTNSPNSRNSPGGNGHRNPNACVYCHEPCTPSDTGNSVPRPDGGWHHLDCFLAQP
jgi:putative DNA primase/helicase